MIFPKKQIVDDLVIRRKGDFGYEIAWDFKANQPIIVDGEIQIVEGLEALRVWIEKALRTERFKWPIYKWTYGAEVEKILETGMTGSALNQALKQSLVDALIYHPQVSHVGGFRFNTKQDRLEIEFEVKTVLDDVLEVNFNV
ncbi:DUF2634 domain-containing protein [Fusibacter sp. JL216-2]|uniref:DUF2634 domain-containing protein n=1 Tax=Fusibacter sp. JL216-2 TaxID=3071453 RepID=UPI003D32C44A